MNSRETIEYERRLKDVMIDPNGKGEVVRCTKPVFGDETFYDIASPVSGHAPESAYEYRKAALIGRRYAQRILDACDNMDRIVDEALKEHAG